MREVAITEMPRHYRGVVEVDTADIAFETSRNRRADLNVGDGKLESL